MTNIQIEMNSIAEREPVEGEQVLMKVKDSEREGEAFWDLGTYSNMTGYGEVFYTKTGSYYSKDDIIEYMALPPT